VRLLWQNGEILNKRGFAGCAMVAPAVPAPMVRGTSHPSQGGFFVGTGGFVSFGSSTTAHIHVFSCRLNVHYWGVCGLLWSIVLNF